MGWKALRDKYGIRHIVHVRPGYVCIGSPYVTELVKVNMTTGELIESPTFSGFLKREYPDLLAASPREVLGVINEVDSFEKSEVVFTYADGKIHSLLCEKVGWPNATHDGELMYENTFSADKGQVVRWAHASAEQGVNFAASVVASVEAELAQRKQHLAKLQAEYAELRASHPNTDEQLPL